jgi:periplasmic protein TonB
MSRDLLVAALVSLALHTGIAFSGRLFKEQPAGPPPKLEIPTIALDLPPPPEPEEPEPMENTLSEAPSDAADLAPPMLNDIPSASMDSPFPQPPQAPPPPGLTRRSDAPIPIPVGPPRTGTGAGFGKIFSLGDLDQKVEPRVRPLPVFPFEMRRSGQSGEVFLEFIVDAQGNVRDPVVIRSSHRAFEQAAIDAVLKWKFKPGKKAGAAVSTRTSQLFQLTLDGEKDR